MIAEVNEVGLELTNNEQAQEVFRVLLVPWEQIQGCVTHRYDFTNETSWNWDECEKLSANYNTVSSNKDQLGIKEMFQLIPKETLFKCLSRTEALGMPWCLLVNFMFLVPFY